MKIEDVAQSEILAEEGVSGALHAVFDLLEDEVILEVARRSISQIAFRVFGMPETAEDHAKHIRAVCRAIERSAVDRPEDDVE